MVTGLSNSLQNQLEKGSLLLRIHDYLVDASVIEGLSGEPIVLTGAQEQILKSSNDKEHQNVYKLKSENDFSKITEMQHDWKTVLALSTDIQFTFIPSDFFEERVVDKILEFNLGERANKSGLGQSPKMKSLYSYSERAKSYVAFRIPISVYSKIRQKHPTAKFGHAAESIASFVIQNQNDLIIDINHNSCIIAYSVQNGLKFCNGFNFISPEDFLYYALYVTDQLKLDKSETKIALSCSNNDPHLFHTVLKKYFPNVTQKGFVNQLNANRIVSLSAGQFYEDYQR